MLSQLSVVEVADNIRVKANIRVKVNIRVKFKDRITVKCINFEDIVVNNIGVKGTGLRDIGGRLVNHNLVLASYK